MTHILLPDDAWADLADPRKVTERTRKPVMRAMAALLAYRNTAAVDPAAVTVTPEEMDLVTGLTEAVMVAMVTGWSFPAEISLDGLQDLPGDAYDQLRSAAGASTAALLPDFTVGPDPKVPPATGS